MRKRRARIATDGEGELFEWGNAKGGGRREKKVRLRKRLCPSPDWTCNQVILHYHHQDVTPGETAWNMTGSTPAYTRRHQHSHDLPRSIAEG